ncbi:MAG: hypothetical protein ACYSYV_09230 [Planctomycetota bacterium]|jgi:hypothetical protein
MRQDVRNSGNGAKRLFERLAAEKKKSVIALCLITVMVLMWVKALTKKAPAGAEAAPVTEQSSVEGPSNPESKISFIELPKVAGRNDVIARDFFASNGWRHFVDGQGQKSVGIQEVNIVSKDGSKEVVKKVAEKLKLQAIMVSRNPRAFINDKVLSVGDKVLIDDGVGTYEFEVVEIKENAVVIDCREAEITLKLMPVSMTDD